MDNHNFNQRSRNIKNVIENHNYKSVKSAKRKYRKTDVESEEDELGEDEVDEEDEEDEGERRNAGRKMDFIVGGEAQVYIEDYLTKYVFFPTLSLHTQKLFLFCFILLSKY